MSMTVAEVAVAKLVKQAESGSLLSSRDIEYAHNNRLMTAETIGHITKAAVVGKRKGYKLGDKHRERLDELADMDYDDVYAQEMTAKRKKPAMPRGMGAGPLDDNQVYTWPNYIGLAYNMGAEHYEYLNQYEEASRHQMYRDSALARDLFANGHIDEQEMYNRSDDAVMVHENRVRGEVHRLRVMRQGGPIPAQRIPEPAPPRFPRPPADAYEAELYGLVNQMSQAQFEEWGMVNDLAEDLLDAARRILGRVGPLPDEPF